MIDLPDSSDFAVGIGVDEEPQTPMIRQVAPRRFEGYRISPG